MLAKIISAGALMILLTGGALASGSTLRTSHMQHSATSEHNIYAGHSNSQQGARNMGQQFAASTVPYGYNDIQGAHAMGGGPG